MPRAAACNRSMRGRPARAHERGLPPHEAPACAACALPRQRKHEAEQPSSAPVHAPRCERARASRAHPNDRWATHPRAEVPYRESLVGFGGVGFGPWHRLSLERTTTRWPPAPTPEIRTKTSPPPAINFNSKKIAAAARRPSAMPNVRAAFIVKATAMLKAVKTPSGPQKKRGGGHVRRRRRDGLGTDFVIRTPESAGRRKPTLAASTRTAGLGGRKTDSAKTD